MYQTTFNQLDISVEIDSSFGAEFTWTAEYQDTQTLKILTQINSILEGGEILTVRFINDKKLRGVSGG